MLVAKDKAYEKLVECIESITDNAGWDVRTDYSGRGMYGKECIGVIVPNTNTVMRLGMAIGAECGEDYIHIKTRSDSLGLRTIVYWPDVEVKLVVD